MRSFDVSSEVFTLLNRFHSSVLRRRRRPVPARRRVFPLEHPTFASERGFRAWAVQSVIRIVTAFAPLARAVSVRVLVRARRILSSNFVWLFRRVFRLFRTAARLLARFAA
jgi:hypothetical protein